MNDFVSVKDFGAVGDGITDDHAAIQAALSSGAATVYIPTGRYAVKTLHKAFELAMIAIYVLNIINAFLGFARL